MSRRNADPATLKEADDLIGYALRHGCQSRQNGSHVILTAPNGKSGVIPRHRGQLPEGTRRSVLKMFAAMGMFLFVVALAASVVLPVAA